MNETIEILVYRTIDGIWGYHLGHKNSEPVCLEIEGIDENNIYRENLKIPRGLFDRIDKRAKELVEISIAKKSDKLYQPLKEIFNIKTLEVKLQWKNYYH